MKETLSIRVRIVLVLATLLIAMALIPQFAHSNPASAQTSTGTVAAGTSTLDLTATANATLTPSATGTAVPTATATATPVVATPTSTTVLVVATPSGTVTTATLAFTTTSLVTICGPVTAFSAPTAGGTGSITVAGYTLVVAPGATVQGTTITVGTFSCLQLTFNSAGQIVSATVSTSTSATPSLNVCGLVTTYTAATSSAAGTITIGGGTLPISAGATFTGKPVTTGTVLCLAGVFNSAGQLSSATISTPLLAAPAVESADGAYRVGRVYTD
ncbi:MAG: hypothetical protein NVSMB22_23090 [Chloroflexota bacterium]